MSSTPKIYLDYAAATPLDPDVFAVMKQYLADDFYNPSAQYLAAKSVRKDIETARASVASCLGVRPAEVIFSSGGTESNNLAIHGVMRQYPNANLVVSSIEHDAVLEPASSYDCTLVAVQPDGRIDMKAFEESIDDNTVLVSIMYANNEIGTIQPLKKIAATIRNIRTLRKKAGNTLPLYFHTDACQAAAYLDLHTSRLGVDMMTINAGKIYGPKQSGALYVRAGVVLQPQIVGGGQERGLRSGTESAAQSIGLSKALQLAQKRRAEESDRVCLLQRFFIDGLHAIAPTVALHGSRDYRLPNNVHVSFPGVDNERLVMSLDERGVMCATGSACSASSDAPSHVLKAIGLDDAQARSSVRFSFGNMTTKNDLETTLSILSELLRAKAY